MQYVQIFGTLSKTVKLFHYKDNLVYGPINVSFVVIYLNKKEELKLGILTLSD